MSAVLSDLGLAWEHPVHGAQQTFRVLLAAMSHPGRVYSLPPAAIAGVQPPSVSDGHAMSIAATVSLLTLLDAESSVHFAGPQDASALAGYFRFHCGVRTVSLDQSQFAYGRGSHVDGESCERMQQGSDTAPQDGATLVLDVDGLAMHAQKGEVQVLRARGPGVQTQSVLSVRGSLPALWRWRAQQGDAFPRGIDLLLCSGDHVAAIPRSTLLALETPPCI
ncbi:phosphonate C-P lyase system protein PhnH [Variovorax sp. Sphag1AA]|uniref:phosphonate C-P lyase system protein PhnH n=1 Tax=Variovorax sp. Sphag1AA TaxID=2587027 RepID=UPI00161C80D0|nr:phosphonate C-P lyase system protein PhnH [Variovorax sp. Sphag1AA]MBB3178164.1 alpha-D-ribose 1-methylphosphonate 5-triphosphate synthase subunit PhnH [Variovorax sp. Sphag1AA]